jgi:hypothetical protein
MRALVCILTVCSFHAALADPAPPARPRLLLDESYPLEVSYTFPAALIHWLDSVAELTPPFGTAGKTTPVHRLDYQDRFGRPTAEDIRSLEGFHRARVAWVESAEEGDRHDLTLAFFRAASLGEALESSDALLEPRAAADLRNAVERFAPRYRTLWNDGAIPAAFFEGSRESSGRKGLADFLVSVSGFVGIPPSKENPPHVVLVPVDPGYGTHAQAIGRHLLIEVQPGETLMDEVGPIVHENVHFLVKAIDRKRWEALERSAARIGPAGATAWRLLHEALPTALAQGLATYRLRRNHWSMDEPWYHVAEIDAYAKRLFPIVREALEHDGSFDEGFVRKAVAAYSSSPASSAERSSTLLASSTSRTTACADRSPQPRELACR